MNAAAYFQSTTLSLFDTMKHVIEAWFDDFIVYATTEAKILLYLDEPFTICKTYKLRLSNTKSLFYKNQKNVAVGFLSAKETS